MSAETSTTNGYLKVAKSGFTNGTTYQVRVRAVNAAGHGPASTTTVTPITTPDAPTPARARARGRLSLDARFQAPSAGPGKPVTDLEIRLDDGAVEGEPVNGVYSHTWDDLENGVAYDVAVRAVNAAGAGQPSQTLPGTPYTTPGAPTLTSATADGKDVTLTFNAPDSNGGSTITTYEYSTNGVDWSTLTTNGNGPLTATVADLDNGTYSFRVRAVNAAGARAPSEAGPVEVEVVATAPAAPTLHSSYFMNNLIQFQVTPPADNGAQITGYEWTMDGESWYPVLQSGGSGTRWISASNWLYGSSYASYLVWVRAVNGDVPGAASNKVSTSNWD